MGRLILWCSDLGPGGCPGRAQAVELMYRRRRLSKETEHDNSNGFGTYPDQSGGSCRLLSAESMA